MHRRRWKESVLISKITVYDASQAVYNFFVNQSSFYEMKLLLEILISQYVKLLL